jgi:hypothetical protein
VNPYLGQTGETLAETGARLGRVSGVPVTMPRAVYRARIADGTITDQDILDAIAASADAQSLDLEPSRRWPQAEAGSGPQPQPTVARSAAEASGIDWPGIIADRFGHWAAAISTRVRRSGPPRVGAVPMTRGGNTRPTT